MPVVIEELEIVTEPPPSPPPAASADGGDAPAPDERELLRILARESWRVQRMRAD